MKSKNAVSSPTLKRPIEILLVEDNPGDATLMREMLKQSRFPVHLRVSVDGEQALEILRKERIPFAPSRTDLLLLDLNLPRKDGHEVLAEIRRSSRLSGIPVLVLTSSNTDEDKWKAYQGRADSYLLKPSELSHFKALLQYLEENWFKEILPGV